MWRHQDGYDWHISKPAGAPFVTVTLGYGLVHEPFTSYGALQRLAGALQLELERSVEVGLGDIAVPEARVRVGADTTTISLRGEPRLVQKALGRLSALFAGTLPLESAPAQRVSIPAATRDVAWRFGMGPLVLACSTAISADFVGDGAPLCALLNPAAGAVRAVFSTNDVGLVGTYFAPPPSTPRAMASLQRRSGRVGSYIFSSPVPTLASFVVPRTSDGMAAVRAIAVVLARQITAVGGADLGVSAMFTPVGPDCLVTLGTGGERELTGRERIELLALFARGEIPDSLISDAVESFSAGEPVWLSERRALGLSDDSLPSLLGTRAAARVGMANLHLFLSAGAPAVAGFDTAIPEIPLPIGGKTFRSWSGLDTLMVAGSVLVHRARRQDVPEDIEVVDVDRVELVLEDIDGAMAAFDDRCRQVELIPDIYIRSRTVRNELAARLAEKPRLRARGFANAPEQRQVARSRWLLWCAGIVGGATLTALVLVTTVMNR